jgi:hypothetical protein
MPNHPAGAKRAHVTIRAREPDDWQEYADLTSLPNVRFGTLDAAAMKHRSADGA